MLKVTMHQGFTAILSLQIKETARQEAAAARAASQHAAEAALEEAAREAEEAEAEALLQVALLQKCVGCTWSRSGALRSLKQAWDACQGECCIVPKQLS